MKATYHLHIQEHSATTKLYVETSRIYEEVNTIYKQKISNTFADAQKKCNYKDKDKQTNTHTHTASYQTATLTGMI